MTLNREQAQQRANDILGFRRELARLEQEQALQLAPEQRQALEQHQQALLNDYHLRFDIDHDLQARRLSLGMRVASLAGALALAASLLFLFYQFWGLFPEAAQVAILVGAPLALLGLTYGVQRRDSSGYFSKIAAMLTLAAFILDLSMLGQIFNIPPSDAALLPWAALALLLAYGCQARLLLLAGLACLVAYVGMRVGSWGGVYWLHAGERPENFFPAALLIFAAPLWLPRQPAGFAAGYRVVGLLALLLPMLILSHWGRASHLPWPEELIEGCYQVLGMLCAALAIWLGVRHDWSDTLNTGLTFLLIFLYTRLYDWWWEVLPKYLFFLIVGLIAVLVLLILRRLRRQGVPAQ